VLLQILDVIDIFFILIYTSYRKNVYPILTCVTYETSSVGILLQVTSKSNMSILSNAKGHTSKLLTLVEKRAFIRPH
jgi:hypothetical protein